MVTVRKCAPTIHDVSGGRASHSEQIACQALPSRSGCALMLTKMGKEHGKHQGTTGSFASH